MKSSNLLTRVERLEAARPEAIRPAHEVIVDGETLAQACQRYEEATGRTIAPDDLLIVREIVDPVEHAR